MTLLQAQDLNSGSRRHTGAWSRLTPSLRSRSDPSCACCVLLLCLLQQLSDDNLLYTSCPIYLYIDNNSFKCILTKFIQDLCKCNSLPHMSRLTPLTPLPLCNDGSVPDPSCACCIHFCLSFFWARRFRRGPLHLDSNPWAFYCFYRFQFHYAGLGLGLGAGWTNWESIALCCSGWMCMAQACCGHCKGKHAQYIARALLPVALIKMLGWGDNSVQR